VPASIEGFVPAFSPSIKTTDSAIRTLDSHLVKDQAGSDQLSEAIGGAWKSKRKEKIQEGQQRMLLLLRHRARMQASMLGFRLDGKDDFAELRAGFEVGVGGGSFGERENAVDDGLDAPLDDPDCEPRLKADRHSLPPFLDLSRREDITL
jgi:hypothetical protein